MSLIEEHYDTFMKFIWSAIPQDHQDAEDFAQEALLKVAKVEQEQPERDLGYLLGVAANAARYAYGNRTRKLEREKRNLGERSELAPSFFDDGEPQERQELAREEIGFDQVEWSAMREEISSAVARLPRRRREIVEKMMQGHSIPDIARMTGKSISSTFQAWYHAKATLAADLAGLEGALYAA